MTMLTHHNKSFLNNSYDNSCVNWGTGGAGEWLRVVEWLYARYFMLTYKFYSATILYITVIQLFNETAVIFKLPYQGSKLEWCFFLNANKVSDSEMHCLGEITVHELATLLPPYRIPSFVLHCCSLV